jgi:HEPN domain-containing protein
VRKAEADFHAAAKLARGNDQLPDQTCFSCQQCVEKYLNALLEEAGAAIPHTHVLDDLLTLLKPHHPSLVSFRRGLRFLTQFAVGTRYPGETASRRQARAALRWASSVRDACRKLLGLRPVPKQRKKSP